MNIALTGSRGVIGGHLMKRLLLESNTKNRTYVYRFC